MQQKDTGIQTKDQLLQRKLNGESVASIAADTGIPRSTIYSWIAAARDAREEESRKKGEIIAADPRTYGWDSVLALIETEDYESCFGKSKQEIYNEWVNYISNYQ